ncbi:UNVERIFIED_CONTAM: hypothetical protein GTU68_051546 [Idotea baltica]|nr:hypothetical protein [Idotea baltica]
MVRILKKIISVYHLVISPWFGNRCRFVPTCSDYAKQALEEHDVVTATMMTAKRICRCHPWGGHGFDPVSPQKSPKISYPQNNTLENNSKS